jgi:hypothetical protein
VSRLALLVAALLAAAAVVLPTIAAGSARPKVRALTLSPLVVSGSHFHPREHVRLTASPGGTRRVIARADGSFRTTFPNATVDRCVGLSLSAVGNLGARATWELKLPQPACAPPD